MTMRRVTPMRLLAVAAVTGATLVLSACGSGSGGGAAGSSRGGGSASGAWPVSISTALGPVTITRAPQRVVTLGWGSEDAALALGVKPVGMSISSQESPGGITPWAKAALGDTTPTVFNATTDSVPYEKIAALHPDVILAVYSGITAAQYKTLSQIAPTVGYPGKAWSTSWPDQLSMVGKALGRRDKVAALEKSVNDQVAAARSAHPEFAGKTAIFGSGTVPGSYNFYLPDDPRMQLLGQLGFTVSDAASTTFAGGQLVGGFARTVSLEQLPKLKADVLVAWYLSSSTQRSIQSAPVFQDLPPVKDKAYLPITDPALLFATSAPNVLSIPWMLKTYVPLLSTAAKNAG